ncbi:Bug family tripartite tricarboxylate transporter substrate binding protein [Muricoccus radiodurans]|uniref:Bug family tripartite tricarboxylate transporter substrate binding protein n=1 Tax=Muricoccus radiodurans TaxID=2231721 RepID=UPI003CF4651B
MAPTRRGLLGTAGAAIFARGARAQAPSWPDRPVRLLVGFAPGGVADVAARLLGDALRPIVGQPFVVENRPGASGVVAASQVARAAPDGHTLLVAPGTMTILPAMMKNLPIDVLRDLDPITLFVTSPNVLLVHNSVAVRDLPGFLELVRSRPPEDMAYASSGIGTTVHFFASQIERATGIRLRHIPYRSSNESITAVVAGDVPIGVSAVNSALPHIQSGAVRAIAIGSPQRSSFLPDVPTFAETGYPSFRSDTWIGLEGPAGMPAALTARIAELSTRVMGEPAMRQRLAALGAEPVGMGPEGFRDLMQREVRDFRELATSIGIQPE